MAKKKPARERGFLPAKEAANSLRDIAARIERRPDLLVKFSIQMWAEAEGEQPLEPGQIRLEKLGLESGL